MRLLRFLLFSSPFASSHPSQELLTRPNAAPIPYLPDDTFSNPPVVANNDSARENANHVFNALHSAVRQFGSSLKHNGMSFFPATVAAGTTFYHGTFNDNPVSGMEWLAFEVEHAEFFTQYMFGPPAPPDEPDERPRKPPRLGDAMLENHVPGTITVDHFGRPINGSANGHFIPYLHTYRTTRALERLLYVDGMSAAKTRMGTLDTQDVVLRNNASTGDIGEDYDRAQELCDQWDVDGIMRMETGFEIILCHFNTSVELVSVTQRPDMQGPEAYSSDLSRFEMFRGVSQRYHGFPSGRVEVDYSSMVSAYFYPINLTNPNPHRPELPRLQNLDAAELSTLRTAVQDLIAPDRPFRKNGIHWQGIVDLIVTRYSDRLNFLATKEATDEARLSQINFLLSIYIDYKSPSPDLESAFRRCTQHYLQDLDLQTPADHLIYTAMFEVTTRICKTLFDVRALLLDQQQRIADGGVEPAVSSARDAAREVMTWLQWSTWKECGTCAFDEVCMVAMWPFGAAEDHYNPHCVNIAECRARRGYWDTDPLK